MRCSRCLKKKEVLVVSDPLSLAAVREKLASAVHGPYVESWDRRELTRDALSALDAFPSDADVEVAARALAAMYGDSVWEDYLGEARTCLFAVRGGTDG